MVVDEERSDVSLRAKARHIRPGFEGCFWSGAKVRETCLRTDLIRRPVRRTRFGADVMAFFSIFLFQIGLQIGPDAGKNAKQADDVVQYCHPTLYFLLREFRERAIILTIGALAQLGERKVRNLEVRGSIPLCSTNLEDSPTRVTLGVCFL